MQCEKTSPSQDWFGATLLLGHYDAGVRWGSGATHSHIVLLTGRYGLRRKHSLLKERQTRKGCVLMEKGKIMWKRLRSFLATPPTGVAEGQLSSAVRNSRNRGSILEKIYRIAELPSSSAAFNALPIVRGYVDAISPLPDGTVNVSGWLLLPDRPLDQIDVYLDGIRVTSAPLTESQEIADLFKWIPHANHSVFNFIVPLTEKQSAGTSILEIVALYGGTPAGRLSHFVRLDIDRFPSPPEDYTFRVAHTRDQRFFKVGGLKCFGEFMEAARRHGDLSAIKRVLDWGCGCGRVTAHLMSIQDGPEVLGSDIDPFAIEWCNRHLQEGAFAVLGPLPPAPYASAHFDLVVSFSVFTHLARDVQRKWLKEMHRLLSPGGLFLATINGGFAYSFAKGARGIAFPPSGIEDCVEDDTLVGIAPKGYYRGTYQAKDYTIREFGRYFQILEYVERGAMNFQDLVVVRKQ